MEDLVAALRTLADKTSLTDRELTKANNLIELVTGEIRSARSSVREMKTSDPPFYKFQALDVVRQMAPTVFMELATQAATESVEYAYDQFLSPLLDLAHDPDLYDFNTVGNGWDSRLVASLNMDAVAGDISDYANAVQNARDALGMKEGRDPVKASAFWRDKIYRKGRYFTTINLRMSYAGGIAPFWSLLNNGNKSASMGSDIGGDAYPEVNPTHFVEETELRLAREYTFQLRLFQNSSFTVIDSIETMILEAETAIDTALTTIDNQQVSEETLEQFAVKIGLEANKISRVKLRKSIGKIESGDYLPAQITISAPGEKRKRVRRTKFLGLVSGLGE